MEPCIHIGPSQVSSELIEPTATKRPIRSQLKKCTCISWIHAVQAKEAGRVLAAEMKSADLDSDGRIDFREFIMYFERLARWRAQQARAGRLNARQNSAVPPGELFSSNFNKKWLSQNKGLGAVQMDAGSFYGP